MKRQVQMLLFVVFGMMLLASAVSAAHDKHRHNNNGNISMDDNDETPGDDCATHFRISSDDRSIARGEEERTLDPTKFAKLTLDPGHNGGVLLRGWDQPNVKVKVCKAGIGINDAEAKNALSSIRVEFGTGSVRAIEPDSNSRDRNGDDDEPRHSWVQLIVQIPANISTEMTTWNGPLSIQSVKGTVAAHTQNGPISFKHSSGTLNAEAHNGPIEVKDSSGNLTLSAQNGPLEIELANQNWQGAGLDARTHNGPIELRVPANYQSGIEVNTSGRAPVSCDLKDCAQHKGTWNGDDEGTQHIRLGAADQPVVIKMSTENGPVSISSTMY
jgi:DUF4097 and DUF4098 domain-containing protein YvlB